MDAGDVHDPLARREDAYFLPAEGRLWPALFSFDVVAREVRVPGSVDWLLPEEWASIRHAAPARIAEFAAGRRCAREALSILGWPAAALLRGAHREPLWPEGVRGSITHTEGFCAAVVAPASSCAGLGIDAERSGRIEEKLWTALFGPRESAQLRQCAPLQRDILATVLFAAKEAFFKSQHALTRAVPEFDAVEFGCDLPLGTLGRLVLLGVEDSRLEVLQGRVQVSYAIEGTLVMAGVAVAVT